MCDDGTVPKSSALYRWTKMLVDGGKPSGREMDVAKRYKQWMIDAGFLDVVEIKYKWPQ